MSLHDITLMIYNLHEHNGYSNVTHRLSSTYVRIITFDRHQKPLHRNKSNRDVISCCFFQCTIIYSRQGVFFLVHSWLVLYMLYMMSGILTMQFPDSKISIVTRLIAVVPYSSCILSTFGFSSIISIILL